jgi:acyl carrier protein
MNDYLPRLLDCCEYALGWDRDKINGGTELVGDFALDEIDVVELSDEIDEAFDVALTDEQLEQAKTIGDIAAHIERAKHGF